MLGTIGMHLRKAITAKPSEGSSQHEHWCRNNGYAWKQRRSCRAVQVAGFSWISRKMKCHVSLHEWRTSLRSYYDSALCFVCAHLAAHQENVSGRNADYRNIIDRSVFSSSSASFAFIGGSDSSNSLSQRIDGASSGEGQGDLMT